MGDVTLTQTAPHDARQYMVSGVMGLAVVLGEQRGASTVLGHRLGEFRYVT